MEVLDENVFNNSNITCVKCGWQGQGTDAIIIDFYGIGKLKEARCPTCDNLFGNIPNESASNKNSKIDTGDQLSNQFG